MKFVKYALVAFVTAKITTKYWVTMFGYIAMATDMTLSPHNPGKLIDIMTSEKVNTIAKKLAKDDIDKLFKKHAK
jgi:hypothetical protein